MENLKILIVEDDLSFALELELLVKKCGYTPLEPVDNSAEALEVIYSQSPDFILMDFDIKGRLSGLEIAEKTKNLQIPVLFITSYNEPETYQRAMSANGIGYLVKPINKYSLRSALEMGLKSIHQVEEATDTFSSGQALYFKKKGTFFRIDMADILYVQASGDFTVTFSSQGKFVNYIGINDLEDILDKKTFFRVHRSYIVNLSKVTSISFSQNKMEIGEEFIPFSRRVRQELMAKIKLIK